MKKTLFFTLLAFAAVGFMSCNDEENTLTEDSGIVGTWEGEDEHHCPIATINADGTYVWEWVGTDRFKDEGKYTYEGNRIVMKPSTYYQWEDNKYETMEPWDRCPRNIKILDLTPGMMRIELTDYFMGGSQSEEGFEFTLFRKGLNQKITSKDLQGTWESYYDDGSLSERIIISGNDYTAYSVGMADSILYAEKSVGTWTVKDNVLTATPSDLWFSFERVNNQYVYSEVNPVTLEAEKWTKASYQPDPESQKIYLAENKLYVSGGYFIKK